MRRLIMQTVPWSFYDLNTYMKQGTVTYNHSSQRGLKWDKKKKDKINRQYFEWNFHWNLYLQ